MLSPVGSESCLVNGLAGTGGAGKARSCGGAGKASTFAVDGPELAAPDPSEREHTPEVRNR